MTDADIFGRAADHWRKRGVPLRPPHTPDEVAEAFRALCYPLSADVLRLYTTVGGFADHETDGLWSLWSLPRIREQPQGGPFLPFADWLIASHRYAFHCEDERTSSVYIVEDDRRVASSVAEFLDRYLTDPDSVWAFRLGE